MIVLFWAAAADYGRRAGRGRFLHVVSVHAGFFDPGYISTLFELILSVRLDYGPLEMKCQSSRKGFGCRCLLMPPLCKYPAFWVI